MKYCLFFAAVAAAQLVSAQTVLPGYLTDPSALKGALAEDASYMPPENLRFPYIATYYVKPTVTPDEDVKVGFFVTDFESSKIRFLDDSHRFTAYLEYGPKGGAKKMQTLSDLHSGDAEFTLGKLQAGAYELRVWAVDAQGRESHRVIHDFRVMSAADLAIPADKVYTMTAADLAAYGIRNDGDFESVVYAGADGEETVKMKRAGVPGYTVRVPLDPKTGKMPVKAYEKAKVIYDEGYDKNAVEAAAVATAEGLQKLIDEKAAAGFRKVVMLPGTYRISHTKSLSLPDHFTLDLGTATIKQNAFTGANSKLVVFASAIDAHLVGGTLEGDYWTHNYRGSPSNSEWPMGFIISGDAWYCSVEGTRIADITGYGAGNGIGDDKRGGLAHFFQPLMKFTAGGLNPKTGDVDASDTFRFTSDFRDLAKAREKGVSRIQVSRYLGYQGCATRSWQVTVAWYDAAKKFISSETAWQYREMWIPANAAFLRVSVEETSAEAANGAGLQVVSFRYPVNCAVKNCRFERCRCVGYAASAMKNMLFEGNFFTASGESAARCAFDAEDGWDQMQDVYFHKNVFRDNPFNNSILTCAGHNFILEKNEGDLYFWGRTHSPCVRDNDIGKATFQCDSRLRSGYGRFDGNRYAKGVLLGEADAKSKSDTWDFVLSGLSFDGDKESFDIGVGPAGRLVNCTFRNMSVKIANAYACTFEKCRSDYPVGGSYPSGRWCEVTVKDSDFSRIYSSNIWERCHFTNTKFTKVWHGTVTAKDCDFTGCHFELLDEACVRMAKCRFDGSTFGNGYWIKPVKAMFRDCAIKTRDDASFMTLAIYAIDSVGFDGCAVSGKKSAVNLNDLRPMKNADPKQNPDDLPATITMRGMKWTSEAKVAVDHASTTVGVLSPKKLILNGKGNTWPEGVTMAADLPATWEML